VKLLRVLEQQGKDDGRLASFECSRYGSGRSVIMAMVTMHARALEHV
jgi:hypothetical protein